MVTSLPSGRLDPEPRTERRFGRLMRSTAVISAGALVVLGGTGVAWALNGQAAGADATPSADTSTPPPLPPAPSGLADQIKAVYASTYHAAQTATTDVPSGNVASGASSLLPVDQYNAMVDAMTPQELAVAWSAIEKYPAWLKLPQTYANLDAQLHQAGTGVTSSSTARRSTATSKGSAGAPAATRTVSPARLAMAAVANTDTTLTHRLSYGLALGGPASFPPPEPTPTGGLPAPPPAYSPASVTAFPPENCGSPTPPEATYAVQVAAAITDFAAEAIPTIVVAVGESFPDPAKLIFTAIASAAEITEDSLALVDNLFAACDNVYAGNVMGNIDANLVTQFGLSTQNEGTLSQVNKAVNEIHDQAHVLYQAQQSQLELDLQQALSLPPGQIPNISYELPASANGYLDTVPVGVKALVTDALANARNAGVPINSASTRYLAQANQELSIKRYKQAYVDYQRAYSEMAQ